jgi:small-conductance mechanosensitive channel
VKCLQDLNKKISFPAKSNLKELAESIYNSLLREGKDYLMLADFIYYFGEENGSNMFELFDIDQNENVSKDEFIKYYTGLFREKKKLRSSLAEKDASLNKLNIVTIVMASPVAFFVLFTMLGRRSDFQSALGYVLGFSIPLSFTFGPVLSEMFYSIFFIFGARPFDIGDRITFEENHYEVKEMGLLYTTLVSDSRYHNFPNEILRKRPVINLRRSSHITEKFVQRYDYESCKEKMEDLKSAIGNFLMKNRKIYKLDFTISDYEVINGDTLTFVIRIRLACPYQDIQSATERRDMFAIFLHEQILKLGILYK